MLQYGEQRHQDTVARDRVSPARATAWGQKIRPDWCPYPSGDYGDTMVCPSYPCRHSIADSNLVYRLEDQEGPLRL
eukprot:4652681-Prymnesium_polylepis.1